MDYQGYKWVVWGKCPWFTLSRLLPAVVMMAVIIEDVWHIQADCYGGDDRCENLDELPDCFHAFF